MKILGIETSCDETAAAVVEDGRRLLSSVVSTQIAEHRLYGGVVPEIASRRHTEAVSQVARRALEEAGVSLSGLGAVAVTAGPGLIGALLVGVNFAKGLTAAAGLALVPVHHIRGHIAANYLAYPELAPPFLCLVASGGHSHIVMARDYTEFEILGRTRDDAAGECFDKAARAMGLGYPGGVEIDRLARRGDPERYRLPLPKVEGAPLDASFSGLKTSVINLLHNARQKGEEIDLPSLAASFEKTVAEALASRLFAAAEQENCGVVSIAGGVSANTCLRETVIRGAEKRGLRIYLPPLSLCGDNAAMIAAQGFFEFRAGIRAPASLNAVATLPIYHARAQDYCV